MFVEAVAGDNAEPVAVDDQKPVASHQAVDGAVGGFPRSLPLSLFRFILCAFVIFASVNAEHICKSKAKLPRNQNCSLADL